MINLSNFAVIDKRWVELKTVIAQKNLVVQFEEDASTYAIYAIETETLIAYVCTIWKGVLSNPVEYTQEMNDEDREDFETNYKPYANRPTQVAMRLGYTPSNMSQLVRKTAKRTSGSDSLLVDGDPTPVVFTFPCDASSKLAVNEIRFILVTSSVTIDGSSFGNRPSLTNGIKLEVTSAGETYEVANIKLTEDLITFASVQGVYTEYGGTRDLLMASMFVDGAAVLHPGGADKITVTVRDDLAHNSFKYFSCLVVARKLD